jgi:citrate lyase subunit beta / citryl-CoA lyase
MDRDDAEASEADARFSARLGFTGKTALSADQVAGIHRAFVPTAKELAWAREVLSSAAHEDVSLRLVDGDPVDPLDFLRAETLIARVG